MAPVQTTYAENITKGAAGMPASMSGWDNDTRIVETDAGIGFGLAVSQGAESDRGAVLGGADFVGISVRDNTLAANNEDTYLDGQNMAVMVRGDIWVVAEDAVAVGDAVEYNATTGALGSDGGTAIANARWMTSAGAGGLAIVRLGGGVG